jgi:hypothetical protein
MLKNAHLLRFPHPSSLQRTFKYASLLRISGALHLGIFEHRAKNHFFTKKPHSAACRQAGKAHGA